MEAGTGELEVHGPVSKVYEQDTVSNKGEEKDQHPTLSSDLYIKAALAHGRHAHTKISNPGTIEITYQ